MDAWFPPIAWKRAEPVWFISEYLKASPAYWPKESEEVKRAERSSAPVFVFDMTFSNLKFNTF
jgi:hypothetical protein